MNHTFFQIMGVKKEQKLILKKLTYDHIITSQFLQLINVTLKLTSCTWIFSFKKYYFKCTSLSIVKLALHDLQKCQNNNFLPLNFSVKSILVKLWFRNFSALTTLKTLNFNILKFQPWKNDCVKWYTFNFRFPIP